MRTAIIALHHAMLEDVFQIFQDGCITPETIDMAFHCSRDYWERARHVFEKDPWRCEEQEVYFFKQAKPLFAGMMEYLSLRYQASIRLPRRRLPQAQFWKDEYRRIVRFRHEQAELYRYYYSGQSYNDCVWFVRLTFHGIDKVSSRIYTSSPESSCQKDWEIAMIIAYEWYEEFVRSQQHAASCLMSLELP